MFRVLIIALALASLQVSTSFSKGEIEPGTIPWTPVVDTGLVPVSILVPPQFSSVNLHPTLNAVNLRPGWTATVYFAGNQLDKPRFMTWGPDSVLYVANMDGNEILAIPDEDGDGIGDGAIVAARTPSNTHDVKFYRDTMFVVSQSGIFKRWRSDPESYEYDQVRTLIDKSSQPNQIGGNHVTRTLVIDTIARKLYLSVGSRGNADREPNRGVIEEYDWDGSNRRIYSRGVRNAVGLTQHPRTGKIWAANNGSDQQGNNIPPEWVDIVREDGFYGYPIAYHHQNYFDYTHSSYRDLLPITHGDSADVRSMVPAAALVAAHCAPMALEFSTVNRPGFPLSGAFMAMRGSWNRSPTSGAKIVYLQFDDDQDTIANRVVDFCTGFIRDSANVSTRWARPVGIALSRDGSVFITSDDIKQFVLRISPPVSTSVGEADFNDKSGSIVVYPNPASSQVSVEVAWPAEGDKVSVYDIGGALMATDVIGAGMVQFNASTWTPGNYDVVIQRGSKAVHAMFTVGGR